MNKISYKLPKVKLIDGTKSNIGYKIWKESKKSVVNQVDGGVQIGSEFIKEEDYYDQIMKMGMQYNNIPYFVFEINGSILFRDLLYNINKFAQWAVSLRLTHSVYDRGNIKNFVVSSEYKGIKEWEDAFYSYFNAIQNEDRTDVNRVTMPYSMHSKYWVAMNYRSLVGLLNLLSNKFPFFYKVYGLQFVEQYNKVAPYGTDIRNFMSTSIDAGYSKYFRSEESLSKFKESCKVIDDYYLVNTTMSLILYSQFIRQTDTDVKGLFDELYHTDPEEFSHKVFTGETLLKVTYLAHKDKVKKTVSNRLCWFSQSDGSEDDPRYWSKFLNIFIKGIDENKFMELLPCKFDGCQLKSCKYAQDVKFRDQGLQKGYIPCAILNRNPLLAERRLAECDNHLNNLYKSVSIKVSNPKLKHSYLKELWTSELYIRSDVKVEGTLEDNLKYVVNQIATLHSSFKTKHPIPIRSYEWLNWNNDWTYVMKGYALNLIHDLLCGAKSKSHIISFGGDVFGYNVENLTEFSIEDTKFSIEMKGTFSIFTSGNTSKRGNHIVGGEEGKQSTVVVSWKDKVDNLLVDALATKFVANDYEMSNKIFSELSKLKFAYAKSYSFLNGICLNYAYCASPFFNESQIQIRDKMVSRFKDPFRPDKTESAYKYDGEHGDNSLVESVVNDNLYGINVCTDLVFPKNTSDLGTLFEVGTAIGECKGIIRYDDKLDRYTAVPMVDVVDIPEGNLLFDCSNKVNAVAMGYASTQINEEDIYYELKGSPDNIMLSVKYTHVEYIDGSYKTIVRDENERDK